MSDYGVILEAGTVRFERVLAGPIERVWAFLTESDKRAKWLAAGEMELRVGGRVELRFQHANLSPKGEAVPERYQKYQDQIFTSQGRVTRCEPPRILAFTWPEDGGEDSEVTFELNEEGMNVRLVLTHRRLKDRAAMINVSGGWHTHLTLLAEVLEGRTPKAFWSIVDRAEKEYEERFAAS
jgi:uncharacterized protein YndB with AHSA1/START domain